MFILGSVLTNLILAVSLILAAAVAGLMAYHYAKAKIRERQGYVYDPDTETIEPDAAGMEQRAKSADEIAQIRTRIETLMEQQQMASETQSQHLGQKLDEIRTHMGQQDMKMDGLKSELRHEIRSRDSELGELRQQLAAALDSFWKAMPALPEAEGRSNTQALPPAARSETAEASGESDVPVEPHTYQMAEMDGDSFSPTAEMEVPAEADVMYTDVEPDPSSFDFNPTDAVDATSGKIGWESGTVAYDSEPANASGEPMQEESGPLAPAEPGPAGSDFELDAAVATFSPVEPTTSAFVPIPLEPMVNAANPEPSEATFTRIEPSTSPFAPEELEPFADDFEEDLDGATFAPVDPTTKFISAEDLEPISADFYAEPAEATFATVEPIALPFTPSEPQPIEDDFAPQPGVATFEPAVFAPMEFGKAPESRPDHLDAMERAPLPGFMNAPPAAPIQAAPPEAMTFEPIAFAPTKTSSETRPPEAENAAQESVAFEAHVFAPISPTSAPFTRAEPVSYVQPAPESAPLEEAPAHFNADAYGSAEPRAAIEQTQAEAPDAEPDSPEEAVWTNASAWTEPSRMNVFSEPSQAEEVADEAPGVGMPEPEEAGPFKHHVVVSPSGDSISMQPNEDVAGPRIPAEASKTMLDAASLFTGGEDFDYSPEEFVADFDDSAFITDDFLAGEDPVSDAPLAAVDPPAVAPVAVAPPVVAPPAVAPPAVAPPAAVEAEIQPAQDRPPVAPESSAAKPDLHGDDLTVISSITEETQKKLYDLGVTKLDEMARWSRADARRISSEIDVSEETIMHQWIFEAQSVLFDSFQDRMARQTAPR